MTDRPALASWQPIDAIQLANRERLRRLAVERALMLHDEWHHEALFVDCQQPDCYLVRREEFWPPPVRKSTREPNRSDGDEPVSHCKSVDRATEPRSVGAGSEPAGAQPLTHWCPLCNRRRDVIGEVTNAAVVVTCAHCGYVHRISLREAP